MPVPLLSGYLGEPLGAWGLRLARIIRLTANQTSDEAVPPMMPDIIVPPKRSHQKESSQNRLPGIISICLHIMVDEYVP